MDENLQEFVDSRSASLLLDRPSGLLRGVKLLGLLSRNGRRYLPAALEAAAGLYENAKVNVNHPKAGPAGLRDYQDRLGSIRNVAARPDGLYGDLHFNPKHQLAEQLMWDAEHAPENVGLSHNVQARTSRQGTETLVEAILKVHSVDLVADPATTRGLFEAALEKPVGADGLQDLGPAADMTGLTFEALLRYRPDLVQAARVNLREQTETLTAQLAAARAEAALHSRAALIANLLAEHRLLPVAGGGDTPLSAMVGPALLEALRTAPDEASVRRLVAERAELTTEAARKQAAPRRGAPMCQEQGDDRLNARGDARSFVRSIT